MRLFFLILLFCFSVPVIAQEKIKDGGECEYEKFKCKIQVVSIEKRASSITTDKLEYDVKFEVLITPQIPKKIVNRAKGREYPMLLENGAYPGPLYLKKYRIESGKIFNCFYHVISRGTCTPSFLTFPEIKLDDYFENPDPK